MTYIGSTQAEVSFESIGVSRNTWYVVYVAYTKDFCSPSFCHWIVPGTWNGED